MVRNVVAGLLLLSLSLGHGQENRPPSRTITDSDGRAVEVVFGEAKAGFVKLERVADGQPFILEISTLSAADQEWVRRQTREVIERIPKRIEFEDGWRRLTIRLPGGLDEPHPVGMRWTSGIGNWGQVKILNTFVFQSQTFLRICLRLNLSNRLVKTLHLTPFLTPFPAQLVEPPCQSSSPDPIPHSQRESVSLLETRS